MPELKFLGHACFLLQEGKNAMIFDPFLTGNPSVALTANEIDCIDCQYILVSHGHADHLGDAVAIAKRTGATVISTAEIARLCEEQGAKTHAMHLGGKHSFEFGFVRVTPAFHGSGVPGGHACGFIVNYYGKNVYHAGDTALFSDMALLGELENIDIALLPIGDNYTMGPFDAARAANYLHPKIVIPMHYNTWPVIAQNPAAFQRNVVDEYNIPVHILKPGETLQI